MNIHRLLISRVNTERINIKNHRLFISRVNAEPTNIKNGQLIGFTDEILANMFAVSKQLCGSKFELKVSYKTIYISLLVQIAIRY